MGHVVALDAQRRLRQAQQVLQLGEGPAAGIVVAGPAQAVPHELLPRVPGDRLVQRPLVAALRHPHLDPAAAQVAQPLLVRRQVVRLHRDQHLLGHARRWLVAIQGLENAVHQPTRRQRLHLVEDEPLAADHPSLAHEEHLDGDLQLVIGDADDVDVLAALGHHLLLLDRLAHGDEAVAHPGGALELQRLRCRGHLPFQAADDLVRVAVEEVAQLLHQLPVGHLLDLAHARAAALLDVEQEARPAEAVVLVELARAAGADGEAAQQQIEGVADGVGMRVRAEVAGALALAAAHDHRPGELLVDRDGEERIALVVAQPDVEPRPVLLDEAVLQHQRLDLVAHFDPLDSGCRGHHLGGARVQVARVLEVVGQALAQAGRLADIDDAAVLVLELVRARCIGNRAGRRAGDHQARIG